MLLLTTKLLLNPTQENEAAIKGLDYIANLIVVYRWQEKTYLRDDEAASEFKDLVKPLYIKVLEYEANLLIHMKQRPLKRWAKDIFQAGDWSNHVATIQLLDDNCKNVTNAIAGVLTEKWRYEEREWRNKLLQQPRKDEEKSNIRALYSKYEAGKNVNPERITGTCE